MSRCPTPRASTRSGRNGRRALAQSRRTFPGVSSPCGVVRSMHVTARSSQAACHSFLTVRRVGIVAARRSTALRFTRTARTQSRSSGTPALRVLGAAAGAGRSAGRAGARGSSAVSYLRLVSMARLQSKGLAPGRRWGPERPSVVWLGRLLVRLRRLLLLLFLFLLLRFLLLRLLLLRLRGCRLPRGGRSLGGRCRSLSCRRRPLGRGLGSLRRRCRPLGGKRGPLDCRARPFRGRPALFRRGRRPLCRRRRALARG